MMGQCSEVAGRTGLVNVRARTQLNERVLHVGLFLSNDGTAFGGSSTNGPGECPRSEAAQRAGASRWLALIQ